MNRSDKQTIHYWGVERLLPTVTSTLDKWIATFLVYHKIVYAHKNLQTQTASFSVFCGCRYDQQSCIVVQTQKGRNAQYVLICGRSGEYLYVWKKWIIFDRRRPNSGQQYSAGLYPTPYFHFRFPVTRRQTCTSWVYGKYLIARRPYNIAKSIHLNLDYRISGRRHSPGLYPTQHFHLRFLANVCYRPSVCRLSVCRLSSVCLSVTFVRPTQAAQIFGNISTALGTLAIRGHPLKILQRSSQGNPSAGGVEHKRGSKI